MFPLFAAANAVSLMLLLPCWMHTDQKVDRASVHIRLVDHSGHELGEPKVTLFKSSNNGRDFAPNFHNGSAEEVPFGVYRLRTYTGGFWSTDREVRVFQPDVWIVVGLELGMGRLEGGHSTYVLFGNLENLESIERPVWLRLSGVYSAVVIDTKVTQSGDFTMAGIPQGLYVLVTTQGGRVLDVRAVQVPAPGPLVIKLAKEDKD